MIDAVLLNDTRNDNHHGSDTVVATIDRLCEANGIRLVGKSPAHHDWRDDPAILTKMNEARLIIVNGEGTIHHDRPTGHMLLNAGPWARERGKCSAMINMTWQGNEAEAVEKLRRFDLVSVRESASLDELSAAGIPARRMPDLASYPEFCAADDRAGLAVSDSVSGPLSMELYGTMRKYRAKRLPIVKLPPEPTTAARWIRRHAARKIDLLSPRKLYRAGRAALSDYADQVPDRERLLRRLASRELMVTGRFHMVIFCLVSRTPFIALRSNTHKIEATVSDAGLEPWRIIDDPAAIDDRLMGRASRWYSGEIDNLERYLETGRADIQALFAEIARVAKT